MHDTHISLKLQLFKGRLFEAFQKEKLVHKAKQEYESDEEPETYLTYKHNLLHTAIAKFILTI